MKTVIFAGPSLHGAPAAAAADLEVWPPAAQGDVLRAVHSGAQVVGLIDGYFEGVPAVLHKELLWAMSRGVHLLGGASMGALRAAELHEFGMVGIGKIFADYRDGRLCDDDEVALVHGGAEVGFLPLSVAMVDLRATIQLAAASGILSSDAAESIVLVAKSLFFKERTWRAVLDSVTPELSAAVTFRLAEWLPNNYVHLKRQDAVALVQAIRAMSRPDAGPLQVSWRFEWTDAWHRVAADVTGSPPETNGSQRPDYGA
jgi:hypothetical protein